MVPGLASAIHGQRTTTQPWFIHEPSDPYGSSIDRPRLLDRVRQALRARHYSPRTEKSYVSWILRYILFHESTDVQANKSKSRRYDGRAMAI
jgi:hypothetical protein